MTLEQAVILRASLIGKLQSLSPEAFVKLMESPDPRCSIACNVKITLLGQAQPGLTLIILKSTSLEEGDLVGTGELAPVVGEPS